jgi:hypothetical protein
MAPGAPFICAAASLALASTGAGATVALPAHTACLVGFRAGAAVCAVYTAAGPGPPGFTNLMVEACELTADIASFVTDFVSDLFFTETETITVTAKARLHSGDVITDSSTWQPEEDGSGAPNFF